VTTVAERVARGAALLDERIPGWWQRINLPELDMRCNCIIHQLFNGSYLRAVEDDLGLPNGADDTDHGFLWRSDSEVRALDAEWVRLIESRRAGAS